MIKYITWHGIDALALENDSLRVLTTPGMGAKVVSLFDKRSQVEWLVGPGERPFKPVQYGSVFTEQDMSGWDEMFPTIVACGYPIPGAWLGARLPDHGEVWTLPWTVSKAPTEKIVLSVEGKALPYRLTRTLEFFTADTLAMRYELLNLGEERLAYLFSAHPQFDCAGGAKVILPAHITEVCNSLPAEWGWGGPETRFAWPLAAAPDGSQVEINRVGSPGLHRARKFFIPPEQRASWAGLERNGGWLRMEWDSAQLPYFGLWMEEGVFNSESVAAPEPMTGYYDSLETAWQNRAVSQVDPGESKTWTLTVQLGRGEGRWL